MEIISGLFMLMVYVTGLVEFLLLGMTFIIVKFRHKEPWFIAQTRSLLIVSFIAMSFWIVWNLFSQFNVILKPVIYLFTGICALFLLKKGTPQFQKLSLLIVAAIFGLLEWQLNFVHQEIKVKSSRWEIGDAPHAVNLYYDKCSYSGMESKDLFEYMKSKQGQEFEMTLYPSYHYGTLAGYNMDHVDGKLFTSDRSWSGGDCNGVSTVMPKYYFGLRGFTLSKMY